MGVYGMRVVFPLVDGKERAMKRHIVREKLVVNGMSHAAGKFCRVGPRCLAWTTHIQVHTH
jgi:hypothetical protein